MILSGANHYGGTTVAEGTLVVANSSALGAGSSVMVGAGAGLLFASPLEASPAAIAAAATPVTASNAASVMAQAANSTFNSDRHDKQFPTVQALDAAFAQYGR